MNRYLALALLTGCATTTSTSSSETPGKAEEPRVERQKIVNISHFDIGSCMTASARIANTQKSGQIAQLKM